MLERLLDKNPEKESRKVVTLAEVTTNKPQKELLAFVQIDGFYKESLDELREFDGYFLLHNLNDAKRLQRELNAVVEQWELKNQVHPDSHNQC